MTSMVRDWTRRRAIAAGFAGVLGCRGADSFPVRDGVPMLDYHVHIGEGVTVDLAIAKARRLGMKFGVLQHAGLKGRGFAVGDDDQLRAWVRSLAGKPIFKGIEAEGGDWMPAFSKPALAELDYIQSDALGMPGADGKPARLWSPDFRVDNARAFVDRYADYHVFLIAETPIDILVVPTFLPDSLRGDYDRLWTPARMRKVIDAAVKHRVAIEIDTRFRVPGREFLRMAKDAGVKFAFGSNYQTMEGIGDISYGVEMYRKLGLREDQFFRPRGPRAGR